MGSLTIDHGKVEVRVGATGVPTLPPVRLVIRTGAADLQTYLTAAQSREFAALMSDIVDLVELEVSA